MSWWNPSTCMKGYVAEYLNGARDNRWEPMLQRLITGTRLGK